MFTPYRFLRYSSLVVVVGLAAATSALTVSYPSRFETSAGNPIIDILVAEYDGNAWHLDFPFELASDGPSVLSHDVPYTSLESLVVGLTEGVDDMGNDKTQIVMFVSDDFAAAAAGQNFSDAFPNTRHSVLISNLTAAVRDQDATQLDWFRDVFLPGDGAAAAFATGGSFSVAEFTSLTVIGTSVTSGNWSVDSLQDIVTSSPIGSSGLPTSTVDETATDLGPFDVEFENTRNPGDFAMELNITNDSGVAWTNIELQLGTGLGEQFEISTSGDVQFTIDSLTYEDTSGAFTDVVVEENRLVFSGLLPAGQTANLVTFLTTSTVPQTFTLRQTAVPEPAGWILQVVGTLIVAVTAKKRRAQ